MRGWRPGGVFDLEIVDDRPGLIVLRVTGAGAEDLFRDEPGGHRWQRVPVTEKHGRVHSSTVTIAVLPEPTELQMQIDPRDLEWSFSRGSGAGGQARNKLETAVDLRHVPSGLVVHAESERSQKDNRRVALATLRARLWQARLDVEARARSQARRDQLGSGERADKRRTVAMQRGQVVDHVTGRRWTVKEYLAGRW
jgi:peptide chain release factor 1